MTKKERTALVMFVDSIRMAAAFHGGDEEFGEPWVKCIYSSARELSDLLVEENKK